MVTEGTNATRSGRGLGVTALYTAQTWGWGGLPGAELLASEEGKRVFDATNLALSIARPFLRDTRSLRHSLLHRHTMIDRLATTSGARHIVELAAGLSRRCVAFSADPSVRYTEIDLPEVVSHKRTLLERTDAGRAALTRPNLRLVGGDVLEIDLAEHVIGGEPLFVIAEGLMMYLRPDVQRALLQKVRALLDAGGTFVFDLVPTCEEPPPGSAGRALEWLMKRFTGGRSFEKDTRTRAEIAADVAAQGFEVEICEPAPVAREWQLPFPEEPTRMVLFVGRAAATNRAA
jgi:O-methyltransferase involved in polyketide biosynthesis